MNYFFLIILLIITSTTFAQTDSIVKAKILDDQQEPDRLYNQSIDKYSKNDYEGALIDLNQAINLRASFQEALLQRGIVYYQLNKYSEAIGDFETVNKIVPKHESFYYLGQISEKRNEKKTALSYYSQSISINKQYSPAYYSKGVVFFEMGDFYQAIQQLDSAILYKQDDVFAFNDRASAKMSLNQLDEAMLDYSSALKINADYAWLHNNIGSLKRKKGDLKGAIASYDNAVAKKADYYLAYNNRGTAKHEAGDFKGAIADFTKAIEIKSDYAFAYNNRAGSKQKLNDLSGALIDCDKAIQLDPTYGLAFLNRGILKDAKQDYKGACVDWNKAHQLGVELAAKYLEVCE